LGQNDPNSAFVSCFCDILVLMSPLI